MKQTTYVKAGCVLTLVLIAILALGATAAAAQNRTTDLCGLPLRGAIGGINATQTPSYSGGAYGSYSGNYSGSYGTYGEQTYYTPAPTPTATPVPQPVNPVNKTCEFGQVLIAVTTDRHGTYRIGDIIVVDVYISTAPEVLINFDNLLEENQLVFGNSEFELAAVPTVETAQENGRLQYHLQLRVRSFVVRDILFVTMDALYATTVGESNTPIWNRLTTPPLMITTTRTLDHGESMLQGDVQQRPSQGTWLANAMLSAGALLFLAAFLLFAIPAVRAYMNRPRPVDPNDMTWKEFDQALTEGKLHGFTRKEYARIAAALRAHISRQPATLREIEIVSNNDERLNDVRSALRKLDAIIFAPASESKSLQPKELEQLERELNRIVPRARVSAAK